MGGSLLHSAGDQRAALRLAQLRYQTPSLSWHLYRPEGNDDKWLPWREDVDLDILLDLVRTHAFRVLG